MFRRKVVNRTKQTQFVYVPGRPIHTLFRNIVTKVLNYLLVVYMRTRQAIYSYTSIVEEKKTNPNRAMLEFLKPPKKLSVSSDSSLFFVEIMSRELA